MGLSTPAPPVALYNMRDYAQDSTARKQLELFGKYYDGQGVNIFKTTIAYNGAKGCDDAPLSSKLDENQKKCIVETWEGKDGKGSVVNDQRRALACIASFVNDPKVACKKARIYAFFLWPLARVFTNRTRLLAVFIAGTALFD